MHTRSRHQGWEPQKWTGKGPVHSFHVVEQEGSED